MPEPSREMRKGRVIRRLRWGVLAAALVVVAGVAVLYLARRGGAPEPEPDPGTAALEPTGDLVTVGEGFERTFSEGDRPVFTVRGARYAVDRSGVVFLEEVEVSVYQEDGSSYEVTGAEARFDVEARQGRLTGGVRISTPTGVTASMEELWVREGGSLLESQGPDRGRVELSLGDRYEGTAGKLWITPDKRLVHLRNDVDLRGVGGEEGRFRLRGNDVILDLSRSFVRADGAAILRRPGEIVRANRIVAFLEEDTRVVRFVRARWDVWARLNSRGTLAGMQSLDGPDDEEGDGGTEISRIVVQCEDLGVLFGPEGQVARELEIEDGPRGVAVLTAIDVGETAHHVLRAPRITADLEDGRPVRAEATGGVELAMTPPPPAAGAEERTPPVEARRATGERAVAGFGPDGTLATVELTGGVTLTQGTLEATARRGIFRVQEDLGELLEEVVATDGTFEATGERGVFHVGEDAGELFGRPAVVVSDRGRMEAPRVRYARADGIAHGTGGVRARLDDAEESALGGTPLGSTRRGRDGEEVPLRVEAEEGFFRDEPRAFLFQGKVRAWQGDDLLLADQLRGDDAEGRVTATGNVRTLFVPEEGSEPGLETPLEVEAEELVYLRRERLLHYTGGVEAQQEGRTVTCREMEVELAEGGGVARVVSLGDVRVVEPQEGRTLEGRRAVYRPDARTIVVEAAEGAKVTLRDREGNVLEGPRMEYDLETGQVRVTGRAGEAEAPAPAAPAASPADGAEGGAP